MSQLTWLNNLTNQKESVPNHPLLCYICGPTVYDSIPEIVVRSIGEILIFASVNRTL